MLEELGRLREQAFRAVGEGTGQSKDTDEYDLHYRHIIVWDEALLEIAGAYRLGEVWKWYAQDKHSYAGDGRQADSQAISASELAKKLYSAQLFSFDGEADKLKEKRQIFRRLITQLSLIAALQLRGELGTPKKVGPCWGSRVSPGQPYVLKYFDQRLVLAK